MLNNLKTFLEKHEIGNDKPVLIGFSGGFDSLCLLDLTRHIRKNIIALHFNHAWRADISDKEETDAKKFCKDNNIKFYSEKASPDCKKTEEEARNLRYDFFERCAVKFNSDILLTAHNFDDNVETILYRIIKGCGIDGLCGIPEVRECGVYKVYRPFLNTKRSDINNYLTENNLIPNQDDSNFDIKYARNFIRHEILPQILKINPKAREAVLNLSKIARENCEFTNQFDVTLNKNQSFFSTSAFVSYPDFLQKKIIRNFLISESLDYDSKKIEEIMGFIKENSSLNCGKKMSLTKGLWLFVSSNEIRMLCNASRTQGNKNPSRIPQGLIRIEKLTGKTEIDKNNKDAAIVDLSAYDISKIETRTRREGDIFQPFGISKPAKLKKYLINRKIPQYKRDSLLLLAEGSEILWIAGVQISEKIRVKDKMTHKLIYERG